MEGKLSDDAPIFHKVVWFGVGGFMAPDQVTVRSPIPFIMIAPIVLDRLQAQKISRTASMAQFFFCLVYGTV